MKSRYVLTFWNFGNNPRLTLHNLRTGESQFLPLSGRRNIGWQKSGKHAWGKDMKKIRAWEKDYKTWNRGFMRIIESWVE